MQYFYVLEGVRVGGLLECICFIFLFYRKVSVKRYKIEFFVFMGDTANANKKVVQVFPRSCWPFSCSLCLHVYYRAAVQRSRCFAKHPDELLFLRGVPNCSF